MAGQLSIDQVRQHASHSPILAFRPESSGSPMQDWCKHLGRNPRYRRELEEFAVVGDVVVRIADGCEPAGLDRVKILSLEYAVKVLNDETDAREFVRCVRAIASPDASQFEYEQIAAYYYGEIRRRSCCEVLKEMGLLGIKLQAVTATVSEREISHSEVDAEEQKLSVADQRRCREIAKNRPAAPPSFPLFEDELRSVLKRIGRPKVSKGTPDELAAYLLDDTGKSLEELDADFLSYEKAEQYDENGFIGFSMNGGQHSVVVYDLEDEVDPAYLPEDARYLAGEIGRIFVGHKLGSRSTSFARQCVSDHLHNQRGAYQMAPFSPQSGGRQVDSLLVDNMSMDSLARSVPGPIDQKLPPRNSDLPFSDTEFENWLALQLEILYPRRVARSVRRIRQNRAGDCFEYLTVTEINPDYDEMQYVAAVCRILWNRQRSDFHLRSLRRKVYQDVYLDLRSTTDTATVAGLKKHAYSLFKEENVLSLKEFTALNTIAKSQESRVAGFTTPATRKWLRNINSSSSGRLRYLKFSMYNDLEVRALTRQEKQRLWDAIRAREAVVQDVREHRVHLESRTNTTSKQYVRVHPSTS